MRRTIETLAWLLQAAPGTMTLGDLARRMDETPDRIHDAVDLLKLRRGIDTQIPPVDWTRRPPSWT